MPFLSPAARPPLSRSTSPRPPTNQLPPPPAFTGQLLREMLDYAKKMTKEAMCAASPTHASPRRLVWPVGAALRRAFEPLPQPPPPPPPILTPLPLLSAHALRVKVTGTELEKKIAEACSNKPWGASSTMLGELAQCTYD